MTFRAILIILFSAMTIFAQQPTIEPGVPQALARWRAARYTDVRYKLDLTLEKMSPVLKGKMEIKVSVAGPGDEVAPIILDWRRIRGKEDASTISNVLLNGKTAEHEELNEHIVIK